VAEGHLQKYKTCPQRLIPQRSQDMPRRMNQKPTQNTKQNHMPGIKKGGRWPPSKVQDMSPTNNRSMNTRHAPTDKQETNKEHKAKPHAY